MSPVDARGLVATHAELRAFALPQGWAIVPLDAEVLDAIAGRIGKAAAEIVPSLSAGRIVAEIETDYFGGSGQQRAAVWRDGAASFGPTGWHDGGAINDALRVLGVRRGLGDEFDALELVRFRRFDDFAHATPL